MINLSLLKTFMDTAQSGSFKMAAYKNFITQPAVSQQIQILEKFLNTRLFERKNKRVFLTPSGEIFMRYANHILSQIDEAKNLIDETNNQFRGTIRVAAIYTIGLHTIQPVIRTFLSKYPQVNIHLEYRHFDQITDMILNRSIDFGLVAYPLNRPGVVTQIFQTEKMVLIQSPDHRIFTRKKVSLADLTNTRFVTFATGIPTQKAIHRFLKDHHIQPRIIHEYDNIETLKNAVILGIGCSIVPLTTIHQELDNRSLEMVPVGGLTLKRPLGIVYPEGKVFTKSTRTFCEMVLKG